MKYAHFFISYDGQVVEMLGSDGVFHLDGRFGEQRIDSEVKKRANMLNINLGKGITGYQVFSGENYSSAKPVGKYKNI